MFFETRSFDFVVDLPLTVNRLAMRRLALARSAVIGSIGIAWIGLASVADAACGPDLAPLDDKTGISNELIISEIDPGDFIELYNTTDSAIPLDGSTYELCSPFLYSALRTLAPGVIVPARGYVVLPWPAAFTDVDAGGEIILYSQRPFGTSTNIMDFVCWGTNPHSSRIGQAGDVGKWSGACQAALTLGSLQRVAMTDGTVLGAYTDDVPSPTECFVFADGFESGDTTGWSSSVP